MVGDVGREGDRAAGVHARHHGRDVLGRPAGEVDLDGAEHVEQVERELRPGQAVELQREATARQLVEQLGELGVARLVVGHAQDDTVGAHRRDADREQQLARDRQVRHTGADELLEAHDAQGVVERLQRRRIGAGCNLGVGVRKPVPGDAHARVEDRLAGDHHLSRGVRSTLLVPQRLR